MYMMFILSHYYSNVNEIDFPTSYIFVPKLVNYKINRYHKDAVRREIIIDIYYLHNTL